MEEKQILIELRKGNKAAFKEFYRKHSPEMHEFAYSFLKNRRDAEDVVQDAFVAILRKHDIWHSIRDMRYYLLRIIQNQCLARLRENEMLAKKADAYNYYQISSSGGVAPPDIVLAINNMETRRKMDLIFSFLSPQRKKAIQLVYMEGKSYHEAAIIMGIGVESIRTHLRLARNILKNNFILFICFISNYLISR